jgi:hypothetical protein
MSQSSEWSKEDFLALLFTHAMQADFNVSEYEMEYARAQVGEERLKKIQDIYNHLSDYEVSELITDIGQKCCASPEDREKTLEQLKELLAADRHFTDVEQAFFIGLRHLI